MIIKIVHINNVNLIVENVCKPLKPCSKSNIVICRWNDGGIHLNPFSRLRACETKTRVRIASWSKYRETISIQRRQRRSRQTGWGGQPRTSPVRGLGAVGNGARLPRSFSPVFFLHHHSTHTVATHHPSASTHTHNRWRRRRSTTSTWCAHARTPVRARSLFGSVRLLFIRRRRVRAQVRS